ncbi:TRAF3-interacting protein 1 [Scaptodrosophila lebanonensis]|uniref:TRAF3-interacting protein 1 n=1 Tax=Drosophila lebanonensis TaxID=7225 RepID=A0A6J2TZ50_DROLE|nr:TRAF3-interacting protein 1 [Scaptodrosophila lebanonensis]
MDVFNAFIKQTGCFMGLYTADEILFENINNRDDKIRYLQKMIDAIKFATKRELKVRTSKIVAGHEPDKTNELLQLLATVADQSLDWQSAVDQVLGGSGDVKVSAKLKGNNKSKDLKPAGALKANHTNVVERKKQHHVKMETKEKRILPHKQKDKKTSENKTKEKSLRKQKIDTNPNCEESKNISLSPVEVTEKIKLRSPTVGEMVTAFPESLSQNAKNVNVTADTQLSTEPDDVKLSEQHYSLDSLSRGLRSSSNQQQLPLQVPDSVDAVQAQNDILQPSTLSLVSSEVENRDNNEVNREPSLLRDGSKDLSISISQRPRAFLRPPSARPVSARPGAPRRHDPNVEIVLQPNDQIKFSGINVKLETYADFNDDGENLVIIDTHEIKSNIDLQHTTTVETLDATQQGHLVQQILKTQKELVQQNNDFPDKLINQLGTHQNSACQMNGLRDVIQNLTKSVNPFGKLMDFIPEDIDAMQLEISMWRESYTQTLSELKRESILTEAVTEPIKQQLGQIEASIREYQEKVETGRSNILQNDQRILKMLMEQ